MTAKYNHIDTTTRKMSMEGSETLYYIGTDINYDQWMITNFSLAGIWRMECISKPRKVRYVQGLDNVDTLLGGGTVSHSPNNNENLFVGSGRQTKVNTSLQKWLP